MHWPLALKDPSSVGVLMPFLRAESATATEKSRPQLHKILIFAELDFLSINHNRNPSMIHTILLLPAVAAA